MADDQSLYGYNPNHVAPAILAAIVGISFLVHIVQNVRYNFWTVTFWMSSLNKRSGIALRAWSDMHRFWGGTVFTAGWIMRILSSYHPANRNLYIAQTCLILGGPPIYAAAEYNVLGRLMGYLPMHAPLNPNRVMIFFIYLGAIVESLTAAGASLMSSNRGNDLQTYRVGGTLVSVSLVLQAAVEATFMLLIAVTHHRAARARMLTRNVRALCIMLYGTSSLVLIRCVFRAIESFVTEMITSAEQCHNLCRVIITQEWYLYVFEALPMALYTIWLNIMHPGRYLPKDKLRYLDIDGRTERLGPGWIDRRSKWETWADPFDVMNTIKGCPAHEKFWLRSEEWPVAEGSFAMGTARNGASRTLLGEKHSRESKGGDR